MCLRLVTAPRAGPQAGQFFKARCLRHPPSFSRLGASASFSRLGASGSSQLPAPARGRQVNGHSYRMSSSAVLHLAVLFMARITSRENKRFVPHGFCHCARKSLRYSGLGTRRHGFVIRVRGSFQVVTERQLVHTLAHAIVFILSICSLLIAGSGYICPFLLDRPGSRKPNSS